MTSRLMIAAAVIALATATACSSTTSGNGAASTSPSLQNIVSTVASLPAGSTPPPVTAPGTTSALVSTPPSTSPVSTGPSVHPVPATPVRTATVKAIDGITYHVSVWAEVHNALCYDHAYGQVATFLTEHPCRGLGRLLATTTVNGRPVGFAESSTSIPGTGSDIYGNAAKFKALELKDGTGSINDLMREGYRLPSGPTSVPSPDAFNCIGQDTGVTVWDVWYLDGPTPNNDPPLITMTQDLFLSF